MSFFGTNIKKIRVVKKLNQTEFAKLFGLTRSAVGAYEEGRAEAKIDKIIEIAEYFGISLEIFLKKKLTLNEIFHYDKKKENIQFSSGYPLIDFVDNNKLEQYIKNINNKEFLTRLPKIALPNTEKGDRAFQLKDVNHFLDTDILICELIETKKLDAVFYLLITENGLIVLDRVPGKKHFKEIWAVKSIISKNTYKFKIVEQLKQLTIR